MRVWVGAVLLAATGCGRSGVPIGAGNSGSPDIPFPEGMHPGGDGVPVPSIDTGRGIDGPIVFDDSLTELGDCEVVVSGNGTDIQLASAFTPFSDGRRIVVAQMSDQLVSAPSSGETMTVTDFKRAGQWEIAEIASMSGASITLLEPLKAAYDSNLEGLRAQACLVHEWTDVTIATGATVSPSEWNGLTGGILAAQISGMLFVDAGARLSADASGFRGGFCGIPSNAQNVSGYETDEDGGGGKGEGLDARFFERFGRGAASNAGGGGNGLNAGGGGGGGAGHGGNGGAQRGSVTTVVTDSEPTHGLPGGGAIDATRLVFGGGGGSGHLDSAVGSAVCGGTGGGALVIRAAAIGGVGWISANGQGGRQVNRNGGGGGGAGGTIDLAAANASLFMGAITADGGEGGDVTAGYLSSTTYGPGGGGGGGHVRLIGVPASPAIHAKGASNGTNESNGMLMGADDGEDGLVTF